MKSNNIFIFGVPRSGTTWLAKIFDSHPGTLLRHEPDTVNPTVDFPFVLSSNQIDQYLEQARDYLHKRTQDRQLRCVSSSPSFPKHYRSPLAEQLRKGMIWFFRGMDFLSRGKLERRLRLPDMVSNTGAHVNVVKSVDSCGRLPLFAKACPEDKFIFIMRHPCGVVASKFRGRELGKMDPAKTFRKMLDLDSAVDFGLTESQLKSWSTLEADAWAWMLTHDFIIKMARNLPNIYVVKYDEFCESPVTHSQAMFDWVGLDWNAQVGEYINNCTSVDPDVRVGFYSTEQNPLQAANKWKTQLSEEQVAEIIAICRKSEAGRLFPDCA